MVIKSSTYVPIVVELIVGEFQLIEGDRLLHPVSSARGAVRVYVNPRGRNRIGSAGNHPSAAVESVSVPLVVAGYEIHDEEVIGGGIQSEESTLQVLNIYTFIYTYYENRLLFL